MTKQVKTTKIEKKYKDKRTGDYKSITIEHAKVKDRLKAFWEQNPNGKIETSSSMMGENVVFKTFILADKGNASSREATGHALGKLGGDKDYEKLETISVGRALALLGYATDGEVASMEEMQDFMEYQKQKKEEFIQACKEKLEDVKSLEELKAVWASLSIEAKKELEGLKTELKNKYANA